MEWIIVPILIILILLLIVSNIVIVQQSRAYVVERLGAFRTVWNVGLHLKVPFIERVAKKVSLKEKVADFAPQPVITRITSPCRSTRSFISRSPTPSCTPTAWSTP